MSENNRILICNVRVNAIADYYDIQPLMKLANEHIQKILQKDWSADGFSVVVQEVLDSSGDKALHDIMSSSVASNIEKLITREDFTQISGMNPFLVDTIKKIGGKHTKKSDKAPSKVAKQPAKSAQRGITRLSGGTRVTYTPAAFGVSSSSPTP